MNLSTAKRRLDDIKIDWRKTLPPGYTPADVIKQFVAEYRADRATRPGLTVEQWFGELRR